MKKTMFTAIIMMFSMGLTFAQTNNVSVLPQNAQDFISQNFGDVTVEKADKEDKWFSWDKNEMYEVHLSNGVKLDFNKAGEITEIDSRDNAPIPMEAVPAEVKTYVEQNHSGAQIVSWERDNDEQEVELSDGTDLEFDNQGKFLKQD